MKHFFQISIIPKIAAPGKMCMIIRGDIYGGDATCPNKHKVTMACLVLLLAVVVFILTHPLCHHLRCVKVEK